MQNHFDLSPYNIHKIEAYLEVLILTSPSLTTLTKKIKATLTIEQRETLLKFLVGVAAANGVIHSKEISALGKVYNSLEIDTLKLDALLSKLNLQGEQPVEIQKRKSAKKGELIPERTKPKEETDLPPEWRAN